MLLVLFTMLDLLEDQEDKSLIKRLINKLKGGNQIYLTDFEGLKDMDLLEMYQDNFEPSANYNQMKNTHSFEM